MALGSKSREVEHLSAEITKLTKESKTARERPGVWPQ